MANEERGRMPARGRAAAGEALGVAIVGCGDIATTYGETLARYENVRVVGAWDRNPPRVAAFVERFGGEAFDGYDRLLADPAVDVVVNLTRQTSHAELTARALEAGRHVYSEKPVAMRFEQASELVALARRNRVRLASAPITFLGEAQRAVWQQVRDGRLGTIRVAYAEANWGRIERWHPRPRPFYEVGPAFDVGVYPLTLLTALLGPARRVRAHAATLLPERVTRDGESFTATAPDFAVALVELAAGTLVRLTASFYTAIESRQRGIELHGDGGMLALDSWHRFDSAAWSAAVGAPLSPLEPDREPYPGVDYARGVSELADAILTDRPHRGSGEHAAHVVEILEAITQAARTGEAVELTSTFAAPDLDPPIAAPEPVA